MAQITIDTEKDSAASMKKMIQLLEHFIVEKGGESIIKTSTSYENSNPYAMFGDQKVNGVSGNSEQNSFSTPTATHNEDMFSMFSNDTPSSSPETYSSPSSTISSAGISVQDLLRDVQDSDDETLIEKKDQDFFQLMHY